MKTSKTDKIAIFTFAVSSLSLAAILSFSSPSRVGSVGVLAALIIAFVVVCSLIYSLLNLVLLILQRKSSQPILSNQIRYGISLLGGFSVLVMSITGFRLPWVGGISALFLIGCFFIVRKQRVWYNPVMALGGVRQSGGSSAASGADEALEQIIERSKGDPRRRQEEIEGLKDRLRSRGKAVIKAGE